MASVDSGVETGNDSNDSSSAVESPPQPSPATSQVQPSHPPVPLSDKRNHYSVQVPDSAHVKREAAAAESWNDTEENIGFQTLRFPFDFSEGKAADDVEPPAGLSFFNIQPNVGLGQGYGIIGSGYALFPYQQKELEKSLKVVRSRLRTARDAWNKVRGAIGERKLRVAANTNNHELAQHLLDGGVNPKSCDEHKRTALHFAACKGYTEIASLLLQRGANPNQKDALGNTPLHLAACTNNIEMVTLLLRAGTNVSTLDNYGRNPLQLAQSKLKLLQLDTSFSSVQMKMVVQQVIEMMKEYLHKTGKDTEAELLTSFASRLTLRQTREEVDTDVKDLLASLSNLSLKKDAT